MLHTAPLLQLPNTTKRMSLCYFDYIHNERFCKFMLFVNLCYFIIFCKFMLLSLIPRIEKKKITKPFE